MWQANPPFKPQIQLVYMNYQCDKPSLQGNLPIKPLTKLVIISNKMWQAFAVRQFIHLTVSCISQVVPSCLLLLGNWPLDLGVTWQLQWGSRLIGYIKEYNIRSLQILLIRYKLPNGLWYRLLKSIFESNVQPELKKKPSTMVSSQIKDRISSEYLTVIL